MRNGLIPNKPGERRGGRQKGTPNKVDASIKEMVLGALQDVGGRAYLAKRALDTPGPFLALVGKILPLQLTGENGSPISVDFRWADATPGPPTIEGVASEPMSVSFVVADETTQE